MDDQRTNKKLLELGFVQDSEWLDYYYLENFPFNVIFNCENNYELNINGEYTIGNVTFDELIKLINIFK